MQDASMMFSLPYAPPPSATPYAAPSEPTLEQMQSFLLPDESVADLLARVARERLCTGLPFLDDVLTLRPGNLLELAGPAGSGKSELLIQVHGLQGAWLVRESMHAVQRFRLVAREASCCNPSQQCLCAGL